jgi:hypothetical protein
MALGNKLAECILTHIDIGLTDFGCMLPKAPHRRALQVFLTELYFEPHKQRRIHEEHSNRS